MPSEASLIRFCTLYTVGTSNPEVLGHLGGRLSRLEELANALAVEDPFCQLAAMMRFVFVIVYIQTKEEGCAESIKKIAKPPIKKPRYISP